MQSQGLGTGEFAGYTADSGDKRWSYQAGTTVMAGPVSYAVNGEQYIAVLAGRGGAIPDLRFASAQTFAEWDSIVLGGSRADRGMRSLAEVLTADDAQAIRAYVIGRAVRVR